MEPPVGRTPNRTRYKKQYDMAEAKEIVLSRLAAGDKVVDALKVVDRQIGAWETWRKKDPEFRARADEVRLARAEGRDIGDAAAPGRADDFVSFRKTFLGYDTYAHQLQWVDILEGREPRELEGAEWRKGDMRRVVVNTFPGSSKSTVITTDFVTWKIVTNPNIRILIVSKKQEFAKKFLFQIKQRLTSARFAGLQAAYAPDGGFKPGAGEGQWAQSTMYVAGRTEDHKDPTLEAVGINGQIYGARADLIIVDDAVVLSNANEFDKQTTWLETEVWSRLKNGQLFVVGTRLTPRDMYGELLDGSRYLSGESPWSYLRQPMVVSYAEDPKDWVTLWPTSSSPYDAADVMDENGMYPMFDGPRAAAIRAGSTGKTWNLTYQQMQVSDDAAFDAMCIAGSTSADRRAGPLTAGAMGHPPRGKEGMYTIASMDPAMSGITFSMVASVDRRDSRIWVENAWVKKSPPATYFREHIMEISERYDVNEWVIEETGFQGFLAQDPELKRWLAARGIKLVGHYTGKTKNDPDFGVAGCAPLFGNTSKVVDDRGVERQRAFVKDSNLLQMPRTKDSPGLSALVDQLIVWEPGQKGSKFVQDGPMALWFLVTRARIHMGHRLEQGGKNKQPARQIKMPFAMRRNQPGASLPPALSGRRVLGGYA